MDNVRGQITIAGAGLVGSLLSVLLGRRGYEVTIFERRPDMRGEKVDAGRSINLALSKRGINALQQAGLMEQVEQLLIPMRGRVLHLQDGSTEFLPYGQRPHEVIYSVSRRDLNCLMMTAAELAPPVNIRFGQKLDAVDFENKSITTTDEDGKQENSSFERLIGTDGAGSRVRRALMSKIGGESRSEFLDHDYKELEIPASKAGKFQIEKEALHIWPRGDYMLIALPNQDGSFTVTLFMPKTGEPSFETLNDPKNLISFFQQNFPDALALIPDLEEDYYNHPQGLLGTVYCSPWHYRDEVLILGDASHAIVPFHGQGMNSGFEDCSELVRLLEKHREDWLATIREFDEIRRPNANAIAKMALENYVTMRSGVIDPKFQLKKEIGFELERRFPNRFVPRYSMVMFHQIPYREALRRGETQQKILSELTGRADDLDAVNFSQAESMVMEDLPMIDFDSPT